MTVQRSPAEETSSPERSPASSSHPTSPATSPTARTPPAATRTEHGPDPTCPRPRASSENPEPQAPRSWSTRTTIPPCARRVSGSWLFSNRLGYRATLRPRSDYRPGDPSRDDWNAGLAFTAADYPTASAFIAASCDRDKGDEVPTGYCDPEIDKLIAAANQQQATHPSRASDSWATIDRKLVDAAATIPYGNSVYHYFVSERIGNTLIHPVTGPLIAQIWVQ